MGLEELKHKYKIEVLREGTAVSSKFRLRSGVWSFDLVSGGGFWIGRPTMVWGPRSSGKTTLLAKAIASFQRLCMRCWTRDCKCKNKLRGITVRLDSETDTNFDWSRKMGVNVDEAIFQPYRMNTIEETLDVACGVLEDDRVGLLIIDTIAMGAQEAELDPKFSVADSTHASRSQTITRWTRKMNQAIGRELARDHYFVLVIVNQARANMQVSYGGGPTLMAPGAKALEYFCPYIVRLMPLNPIYAEGEKRDEVPPLASVTSIEVTRNKVCLSPVAGRYEIMLREKRGYPPVGHPNEWDHVLNVGQQVGYIGKNGSGWKCGQKTVPKKESIQRMWASNPDVYWEDSGAILELALEHMRRPS